ncbi:MAG: hypothetical protein HZB36_03520 [Candidatus Omnitrophica bacterium]|nr:hypothetical protein [Candidatus Omnitrophota bacterium]
MIKKAVKISYNVKNYVISRKKKNHDLSCRKLANETSEKFNINISKSSISSILKAARISSPVGRNTERIFRPDVESAGAGYAFILGASLLLGVSKIISEAVKKAHPLIHLKSDTLEAITEAWIMAKSIYNVPLEKIEDYRTNEMWFIVGRKINKGLLRRYIEALKTLQAVNYQIVSDLMHTLQDVHYMRFTLADNAQYILDGQLKGVWKEPNIPIDFCTNIDITTSYVNRTFFGPEPIVIFNSKPESALGEEVSNFIFSIDGASAAQRIRKIEIVSPNSNVIKEIPFIIPERRRFIIGIWPWQYKAVADLEKRAATGRVIHETMQREFYYVSDSIKFVQHANNIEVMLRLIVLKSTKDGPATIAILTNLDEEEWDVKRVIEHYLRRWPNPEAGYKLFLKSTKNPGFFDEFISGEKIFEVAKKISATTDCDALFSVIVEVLNEFSKRTFFPRGCSNWSLLKMREIFYKQQGRIKRALAEDVLYNILLSNMLEQKEFFNCAAVKFNESSIFDFSGRKLWILPQFS